MAARRFGHVYTPAPREAMFGNHETGDLGLDRVHLCLKSVRGGYVRDKASVVPSRGFQLEARGRILKVSGRSITQQQKSEI